MSTSLRLLSEEQTYFWKARWPTGFLLGRSAQNLLLEEAAL